MKNTSIFLLTFVSLLLLSGCSDENYFSDDAAQADTVTLAADIAEPDLASLDSRGATNSDYQLRFVMEVWQKDASGNTSTRVVRQSLNAIDGTAQFVFRLDGSGLFRILLWADYIIQGADADTDCYYCTNALDDTKGLKQVQVNTADYTTNAMRDAFSAVIDFEKKAGEGLRLPLCALQRAVSRLALYEKVESAYLHSTTFDASYTIPCEFDVEKGQVSANTFDVSVHESVGSGYIDEDGAWLIFDDHVLVSSRTGYSIPEMTLTGYDISNKEYNNTNDGLKNIKLSRNKTTKVMGSYMLVNNESAAVLASYTASLGNNTIELSPWFGSFNGRSSEGPGWNDANFVNLANWMSPALVRYPGGTLANSWDWRQGGFMGKTIKYPYLIKDFATALSSESDVLYVMNMVNPTPATGYYGTTDEVILQSDACLQAKINDLLDALAEFDKYGHLPVAVELGNELYFNNPEKYSDYGIYMGNPQLYMQHAKVIAKAIKDKYPSMKVLLCTSKSGNGSSSRDTWNNTVFSSMTDEMYQLTDGFVQHHYIKKEIGSQAVINDDATAEQIIAEGFNYAASLKATDYALIPQGKKLWITEFGLEEAGNALCDRWVNALEYYAMTTSWFDWADKIETVMLQHITLTPGVLNEAKTQLSSVGIVYGELLRAMKGRTNATRIQFEAHDNAETETVSRLSAWCFSNPTNPNDRSIVIVNPTATEVRLVDLSSLMNDACTIKQYRSDSPYADIDGSPVLNNGINLDCSQNLYFCSFSPFSMTVIARE